jgi:hypothetical protein
MRHLQISLLLLIVGFATGCPKPAYRPTLSFDQGMVDKFNAALKGQYREYECYRFGPTHTDFQGKACTGYTQNQDNAKGVRNELIETALSYIDQSYMDFVTSIQAGRDQQNYLLDLVDLSGAAAVGITKGERALQIIGVGLTAFRGGRKSYDANFYKDTSTPILISKMDGNRAVVRAIILQREKDPAEDYTMGSAVSDIVDYYNAGTLVRAFTQLQEDTAIKTEAAQTHLANLKAAGVKGAPTKEEIAASGENSARLASILDAYTDANNKVQAAEKDIAAATQDQSDAGPAITAADQAIGAADAQLAAAKTPAAKALAEAAKTKAQGEKATAEAKKLTADTKKAAAETAKADATKERDKAFGKLKATYEAVQADSKLSPLLNQVPENPNLQPQARARRLASLQRLIENKPPANDAEKQTRVEDYTFILLGVSNIVAAHANDDAALVQRWTQILEANK